MVLSTGLARRVQSRVGCRAGTGTLAGIGLLCLMGVGGCASTATPPQKTGLSNAELHRKGRVILAGQVTPAQIRDLHAYGVRAVVSCRGPDEMAKLPFDEPGLLDELDMDFTQVPLGGSDGYSPEDVDAFAAALLEHDGDVLVHCSRGGRVRTLYAAYLVRYQGYSADDAKSHVQTGPTSFERLLGERLRYEMTGEPLPPDEAGRDS